MTYATKVIMVNRAECSFHKLEYCKKDNEEPSSCVIPAWFWQGTGKVNVSLCVCSSSTKQNLDRVTLRGTDLCELQIHIGDPCLKFLLDSSFWMLWRQQALSLSSCGLKNPLWNKSPNILLEACSHAKVPIGVNWNFFPWIYCQFHTTLSFGSWWDYTGSILDFFKSGRVHSNLADQWSGMWDDES